MASPARRKTVDAAIDAGWILLPATVVWSISAGQAVAGLLIAAWTWKAWGPGTRARRQPLPPAAVVIPLAAFLVWTVAAAVLSAPRSPAVAGAAAKWSFALLLPAAWSWARGRDSIRWPLASLLAAGLLALPSGLAAFLESPGGRAGGFSGSGPHLGSNLMMAFLVATAIAFRARTAAVATAQSAVALLLLGGVGLTLNRSALLGCLVGAGLLCARRKPQVLVLAFGLLAAGLAVRPDSKPVLRLRSALQYDVDQTASERLMMWQGGTRMIRAHPLAGISSAGRFTESYATRWRDPRTLEPRPGHVHNSYIQTAILHGIPGLGLMAWWLVVLVRLAARSPQEAALPLFVAVLVNAGFDFVLADGQHALMWYALLGMLLGASTPPKGRRGR